MIDKSLLEWLKTRKNLLAFSGGGDSSALFFLLVQNDIPFDIAIVDYGVREQSKAEVAYAKELAKTYNLQCHHFEAQKIQSNFEAKAREIRYEFFDSLITTYAYDTLLSAHHLGDRLEWFLMQLCKGAGCVELGGMQMVEKRKHYTLVRPLLQTTKEEIYNFLHTNKITYFEDETNDDTTIKRNRFRHHFAAPLLEQYTEGIKRSFRYIDEDIKTLLQECQTTYVKELCICQSDSNRSLAVCVDKELKKKGVVAGRFEKEALKNRTTAVVARKFVVAFYKERYALIAPYITPSSPLEKKFKEECRLLQIEPKLRPYLFTHQEAFDAVKNLTKQ